MTTTPFMDQILLSFQRVNGGIRMGGSRGEGCGHNWRKNIALFNVLDHLQLFFTYYTFDFDIYCSVTLSFMETLYLVSQSSDRHNKNDTNLIRFTLLLQFSLGLSQGVLITCFLYAYSARTIPVLNLGWLNWG